MLVLRLRNHHNVRSRNVLREAQVHGAPALDENLSKPGTQAWTYDFDTRLDIPCTLQGMRTFPSRNARLILPWRDRVSR